MKREQCNSRTAPAKTVPELQDKDNRMDHFDLCEACYDELTGSFKIKLEEE